MRKYWRSTILFLSLTANLIVAGLSVIIIQKKGGMTWLQQKADNIGPSWGNYSKLASPKFKTHSVLQSNIRMSVFDQLPLHTNDIVYLGDSIFAFGEWQELMNDTRAKNRAISGDDTSTILKRLDKIISGRPANVVLLCGINNIQEGIPFEQTSKEYAQIVNRLVRAKSQVWLIPVFPVNPEMYRHWILPDRQGIHMPSQTEVERLNHFISQLAVGDPALIHYVSISSVLDHSNCLATDFTVDGLHLNGRGLNEVAKEVKSAIIRFQ